jgi:hypothetical protein
MELLCVRLSEWQLAADALALGPVRNQIGLCHAYECEDDEAMREWKLSIVSYVTHQMARGGSKLTAASPVANLALMWTHQGRTWDADELLKTLLEYCEEEHGKDDLTTSTLVSHTFLHTRGRS